MTTPEGQIIGWLGLSGGKPSKDPVSELVAVDLADRSELWRTTLEDTSRSGIAIEGQRAYVADDEGGVYAIEIASGAVVWTAEAIGRVDSPPAVADGNVYVAARDVDGQQAQVLALDAETGERRWVFAPQAGAVAASAISTRYRAIRSFTEPPMLYHSSFAYTLASSGPGSRFNRTSGVRPMRSIRSSATTAGACVVGVRSRVDAPPGSCVGSRDPAPSAPMASITPRRTKAAR